MRDATHAASAFHAMALVASARAAIAAARAVADRRAERDASAQEAPATAADDLAALAADAGTMAVQLRLRATVAEPQVGAGQPEPLAARLAQGFETRLLLADLVRTLKTAHQKLLSLFPAVAAETVEATRLLAADAEREATAEAPNLARLACRVSDWHHALPTSCP